MWKFLQADKHGTPAEFEDGMQLVNVFTCPPLVPQKNKVFSQKLTTNGLATGTSDMSVDGSVTPVEYYVKACNDNDLYLNKLSFILGYGASAEGYEFADSGAALTNGIKVCYFNAHDGEIEIKNLKSNYSFMRASDAPISIGNWETRGFAATGDYGFFVNISLSLLMPPYGIKLDRRTIQKFCVIIQDDCTSATLFNANVYGFERFE